MKVCKKVLKIFFDEVKIVIKIKNLLCLKHIVTE